MGKRRRRSESIEKIKKKIRKLEKKISDKNQDEDSQVRDEGTPPPRPAECTEDTQEELPDTDPKITNTEEKDELPEEFLLALGSEGLQNSEVADPIREELAQRWRNIMHNGLTKEAKEALLKKYATPSNFQEAIAPKMNPEIYATLSETSVNRDKRIIYRQNQTGKLLSCLGKSLSRVLKGDINSKTLIEEINDAAKIAAEIFHKDTVSRKFFALAGTSKTVKDTIKNQKPDEFLFGKDCSEKIKIAQGIQRTSTQIKTASFKDTQKKQGNWKSPLPQTQQTLRQGPRGGRQPRSYNRPPAPASQPRRNWRQPPPPPPPPSRGRPQYRR